MDNNIHKISSEKIAAYLDGNVSSDQLQELLHAIGTDKELREVLEVSRIVDADMTEIKMNDVLPMTSLAAHSNNQNTCALICEIKSLKKLGIDIIEQDILHLAKEKGWLRKGGVALHNIGRLAEFYGLEATRKYKCTLDEIKEYINKGICVIVAVDEGELMGESISEDLEDMYIGRIPDHSLLVMGIDDDAIQVYDPAPNRGIVSYNLNSFKAAWADSSNYSVLISKPGMLPYIPHPIDLSDVYIDSNLNELREAIAENAHEVWAKSRLEQGWTYGPTRNDKLKQTPDLVPYAQLPDSEKLYDREMAMNTIKLLKKLGYDIVKKKY